MKMLRVLLLLVVGCLSGLSTSVSAETIPATSSGTSPVQGYTRVVGGSNKWYNTLEALCTSQNRTVSSNGSYPDGCCYDASSGICFGPGGQVSRCPAADGADVVWPVGGVCQPYYSCPSGQGWTLSDTQCTRPDCVAPQVRQSDGTCAAPAQQCDMWPGTESTPTNQPANCSCPPGTKWNVGCRKTCGGGITPGQSVNAGWDMVIPKGQVEACWGGCGIQHVAGPYSILKDGSKMAPATYTGWACSGNGPGTQDPSGTPAPDTTKKDKAAQHDPKCGANEGVVTVSTGKLLCLPAGTDVSVPQVQTKIKTETFSDNSTKTTETTITIDPATSVSDTRSTITATGGLSGTAGTSSSVETSGSNSSGTGTGTDGKDGTCDPKKDFCGGPTTTGIYTKKTKTVESVMTTFKDGVIASPIGSAITGFFNVTVSSGSCPDWSVDVPVLATRLDIGQHFCTANAIAMMELAGNVLLIGFSIVAFRWAIL